MQISPCHSPNTLAFAFAVGSGTMFTLYRAVPGETVPRMQMQVPGGSPVDCGAVEAPERFGAYDNAIEFKDWVRRFAT